MGPTPVYGARAEKPLQNADFAMKQTNICRLSGDIIIGTLVVLIFCFRAFWHLQNLFSEYLQLVFRILA